MISHCGYFSSPPTSRKSISFFLKKLKKICIDFGRERKGEWERNIDVREKLWLVASYTHPNRGSNLHILVYVTMLQAPEHTGQGQKEYFFRNKVTILDGNTDCWWSFNLPNQTTCCFRKKWWPLRCVCLLMFTISVMWNLIKIKR